VIDLAGDNEDLQLEFVVYLEKIMKCRVNSVKQGGTECGSGIGMESTYSVT